VLPNAASVALSMTTGSSVAGLVVGHATDPEPG
jgi:hypothetical protein